MKIETERLIIDDIRPEDREDYFTNISHDKEVLKTFICVYQEDLDSFDFSRYLGRDDLFAIREKESGRLIGIFVECDVDNVKKSLEIGYGFGSRYWGKGYATEAVKAMIAYYFTKSGMKTVYASFFPENVSSKHVMEKCGMTFSHINEKELTYLDKERDLVYFKIESGIEQSRKAFLNSFDFMRLGQAISSNNTQIAVMAAKGLEAAAREVKLSDFERLLSSIRLAMISGSSAEALDIMTQLTARRVKLLNDMNIRKTLDLADVRISLLWGDTIL